MLLLRPELVDPGYRDLPPARYSMAQRLRPNYPLRGGGQGYVGDPARADLALAKVTLEVLLEEATDLAGAPARRPSRGPPAAVALPPRPVPAHRLLARRRRGARRGPGRALASPFTQAKGVFVR